MKYEVVITWPCRAVVAVDAPSREDAEERALEDGLPWDRALEDDDGASTAAVAHDPGCPAATHRHEPCRCEDGGLT